MGASATLPAPDPHATADLAAAALEHDPDDWHLADATAHLAVAHPQLRRRDWSDDDPYAAHDHDHRQWNHDHHHHAHRGDPAERFAALNPDFGVLPDHRDPAQHRFAADREQALALGTRAVEALRAHNHHDPQRRERAVAGMAVEAKLRAAGDDQPTRQQTQRAGAPAGPRPLPERSAPERVRCGPER
jgi:hypothetical protein